MAGLEVFWDSGSPYVWRVLLALEVKQVRYISRRSQFSKDEHKTPEFLAMNPRGKIPVVRFGDFTLYESMAILAWLDRKWSERPIFGRDTSEHGQTMVGDQVSAADIVLLPAVQLILRAAGHERGVPLELGFLPLAEHYPKLAAWLERMEALPGYDRTYPPHWRS